MFEYSTPPPTFFAAVHNFSNNIISFLGNPSERSQSFGLSLLGAAFSNWFGGALEHDYTPSHGFGGAEGLRDQAHLFFFRNGVGDVLVNFLTHEGEGAEGEDREACMDASGFRVSKGDSVG